MTESFFPECNRETSVVDDYASGDTICTDCGLVLEARNIDERGEWRTFAADDDDGNDPCRVGAASNPLLSHGGLGTVISPVSNSNSASASRYACYSDAALLSSSPSLWRSNVRNSHSCVDGDRSLIASFATIAAMCDRLGLVATIKDQANEIYKKVEDIKLMRGKNHDPILAACLYIACRQEKKPRTIKEILSTNNGTSTKEVMKAKDFILKQLKEEKGRAMEMGTIHAEDFLRRFCSHLGMNHQAIKAAIEVAKRLEELHTRSPISIAATSIYIISWLSEEKRQFKDISSVTGVSEGTIKNAYKDLHPQVAKLIPDWYAKEEDLKKLSAL